MKKTLLAIAYGAVSSLCFASTSAGLWDNTYRVDTLAHFHIGPGVTHTHLLFSSTGRNLDVVVATLDKTDPSYSAVIKPRVEIGCDEAREVERVSEQAIRKSDDKRQYIAAINGDFFNMTNDDVPQRGWPVNGTVIDGKFATPSGSHNRGVILGPDGMWIDDVHTFAYVISSTDGSKTVNAESFNCPYRNGNALYVFNDYMQNKVTTSADHDRDLCLVMEEGSEWAINKPMKFKVSAPWRNGAGEIPVGGIVLTATVGYSNEWLDKLTTGDELTLEVQYSLPGHGGIRPDVTHLISGDVHFLNNGATEWNPGSKWYGNLYTPGENYPMSMAGFSEDQNKFVLASISRGGPNNSTGINYPEAADLMRFLGCHNAVNFDGGGSTTMYAAPIGVVSFLQYGTERPVGNGLFLAMDTPKDSEVTSIRTADHVVNIPYLATYKPIIYGYNKYGQLVDMNVGDFSIDANENFDVKNNYIIADKAGTFALAISKGEMHTSVTVNVSSDEPTLLYPDIVIDRKHQAIPTLHTLVDGYYKDIEPSAFTWESDKPTVATVNEITGEITAVSNGTAVITVTRGEISMSVNVTVEIPVDSEYRPVATDFGDNTWVYTPDGIAEGATIAKDGDNAWTLTFKSNRKRGISLNYAKDFVVYGLPEAALISIDTNGTLFSGAKIDIEAANGHGRFEIAAEPAEGTSLDNGGKAMFDFSKHFDITDYSCYPLTFHSITLSPYCDQNGAEFKLDLSDFLFRYAEYEASSLKDVNLGDTTERLSLIVSGNTVTALADVTAIEIFSIDGRLVATAQGRSASVSNHGIYIVRAYTANGILTAKAKL